MEIVKERISKNFRVFHNIMDMPSSARSYSSFLLLREHYRDLDIDFNQENDWRYLFIVRRHWLRKRKKLHNGHWVCHYCNKPVYHQSERNKRTNRKDCITVDHKIPASQCNDILDTKNFLESCYKCNHEKGDMSYEEFVLVKNSSIVVT